MVLGTETSNPVDVGIYKAGGEVGAFDVDEFYSVFEAFLFEARFVKNVNNFVFFD